jgi:predicted MFS family arabinose efflux permease
MTHVQSYRAVVFLYAALGVALAFLFPRLSKSVEASPVSNGPVRSSSVAHMFGISRSRKVVLKLSGLFALDSFAGGFVVQGFAAYWFYLRYGVQPAALGAIFFWANVFAGISALFASRLASRIGLIRTMVVTHLPSNILLILVPLMPNLSLAVFVLLLRFSISQMDVFPPVSPIQWPSFRPKSDRPQVDLQESRAPWALQSARCSSDLCLLVHLGSMCPFSSRGR